MTVKRAVEQASIQEVPHEGEKKGCTSRQHIVPATSGTPVYVATPTTPTILMQR